ncbi:hypothetical protein TNCV_4033791 [Trichonephila clavipes]|nr:hypothetical protein TNCV_4033791 [Trichonephila clavipes]
MVNDIALMELQQPVKCSGKTSPICVPTKADVYKMGQRVYVAGWGKNIESGFNSPLSLSLNLMCSSESKLEQDSSPPHPIHS